MQGDHDFYTYEAKYLDGPPTLHKIPADIPENTLIHLQEIVRLACRAVNVE